MICALPAEGIAPDVTGKPGEVGGSHTCALTTRCKAVAAQFKNYSCRVKEGMGMRTLDRDLSVPAGYHSPTFFAVYGFNRAGLFLLLFVPRRLTRPTTPSSIIGPKPVTGASCCLHCNIPQ